MRTLFTPFIVFSLMLLCIGCSEDPPSVRVRNDFSKKVNTQFKWSGNTFNINDVMPGTASGFQDVSEGEHTASASIQGESAAPTATFNAKNDNNYTIVITNTTPPGMRVDVAGK